MFLSEKVTISENGGDFINSKALSENLEDNLINLRSLMSNSSDLNIKHGQVGNTKICIIHCEGMASTKTMAELIFRPLNEMRKDCQLSPQKLIETLRDEVLIAGEQQTVTDFSALTHAIMSGFAAILANGCAQGLAIGVQGFAVRSVSEPSTHSNIRGSLDGFVETIRTNMSLVRRRIKSPDLVFELKPYGSATKTDVCLCYMKGKVSPELLSGVRKKLEELPFEAILEGGFIQPFLEKKGSGIFTEIGCTDRPDSFAAKLYSGRVGVLIDGTPFALYVPQLIFENFTTVDDYTGRPAYASLMRLLRYFACICSVLLPGFYVALANFNPELFPDSLLINLSASIEETPYPLLTECLLIHIFFEIMREAGLRLPKNVGHAVSVVGGLVIGDIVVSAGLVGAPLVLIVALSAITGFIVPDLYESMTIMRFCYIIAGGLWGLFGLTMLTAVFAFKICSMDSYGVPFTAPIVPFSSGFSKDLFVRLGWRSLVRQNGTLDKMNGVDIDEEN